MPKSLFIAEKPSVARQFAGVLREQMASKEGYLESKNYIVTWCVGHLVTMSYPDNLTTTYPKYVDGWNVLAHPNGDLKDLDTDKDLYALYYECLNTVKFKVEKDGFVVKGEDVAEFLEEKLEILGLNYKEKEEFIVYWLPKLEANKYNYIRFATTEEIDKNMPLEITPKPDTTIRIFMTFKRLNKEIDVEEQQLEPVKRNGFVAVEWGGTEIK